MSDYFLSTENGKRQEEFISLNSHCKEIDFAIKQELIVSEDVKNDTEHRLVDSLLELGKRESNTGLLARQRSSLDCSREVATVNNKEGHGDGPRDDTTTDVIIYSQSIKKEAKNEDIGIKTNIYVTNAFINNLLEPSLKRLAALETCPAAPGNMQFFNCRDCDYKGKTQVCLRKHIKYNHKNITHLYECSDCEYKTKNQLSLERHIKYNHSNNFEWHKCNVCDYKAKCKTGLQRHVLLKHDEDTRWLSCQICEYKTKDEYRFKGHMIRRHYPECHQCQFCDYVGKTKRHLKEHVSRKHDENCVWYQCSFCDYKTKVRQLLKKHFKVKHDENAEWYQCALCDYKTKLKGSLTEHTKMNHNKWHNWHRCQLCDYKTKFKNYLDLHMECKHKENCKTKMKDNLVKEVHRKSNENTEIHHCQFCDLKSGGKCTSCSEFEQESIHSEGAGIEIVTEEDDSFSQTVKTDGTTALGDNSQNKADQADIQISVDPEDFEYIVDCGNDHKEDYVSSVISGNENVNGDVNIKSNTCSQNRPITNNDLQSPPTSLKHKVTRNKHSKRHIKVKRTEYETNDSSDLKGYGDRQYRCLFCDYSANTKKEVNQHVKVKHVEKVKWHQCALCEYKTNLKRFLDQHLKYKHNVNVEWFQCKFCDYKSKSKYYLIKHVKCRHKEKCDRNEVFQCAHCSYKTHLKHYLANHFKRRSH